MNVDKKSLEAEFSNAICRPTGDNWQSKTLFLEFFDPRSSIKIVFDCRPPGVIMLKKRTCKITPSTQYLGGPCHRNRFLFIECFSSPEPLADGELL